jgi:hypothetical protein
MRITEAFRSCDGRGSHSGCAGAEDNYIVLGLHLRPEPPISAQASSLPERPRLARRARRLRDKSIPPCKASVGIDVGRENFAGGRRCRLAFFRGLIDAALRVGLDPENNVLADAKLL